MIVIEVNSIRRSGHHAFIHWLISNIHETKYDKNLCQSKHTWIKGSNNIMWLNEGEHDEKPWISYLNRNIQDIDILIISYESWSKTTMNNPNYSMLTDELREKWGVTEHIQIPFVRDFYNNFASLLTRQHHDQDVFENFYTLYRKQLERALTTFRGVIYDKWISDEEYANEVCMKLIGKPNKYNPLEIGGTPSSYDEDKLKVNSLLNRYKSFTFPKWLMDKLGGDGELQAWIKRAGMDKSDVKS